MSDYLISLIRTTVPVAVGAALTWLATRTGLIVDEQSSTALTIGVTGLAIAVYYALTRALEARWSWLGWLLGATTAPTYHPNGERRSGGSRSDLSPGHSPQRQPD